MKRILCIMHLPPPLHGASQSNYNLAKSNLINSHYKLQIINLQFSSSLTDLRKFSFLKIWKALKYAVIICYEISNFKPDLVYLTLSPNGFAFYRDAFYTFIVKLFRVKILFHLHGKGIKKAVEKSTFRKSIYGMVFKGSKVICLTNNLIEDIEDVYFEKPFIVPNGLNVNKDHIDTDILKTNKEVKILYLGNYKESKGILILIDVLKVLKSRGYIFNARLVGGPADLSVNDLNRYIDEKNLENEIVVVGPKYGVEKYSEYKTADIFVFPTFYANEAFPLVILEAMQFGLPVISTDEGGIAEAVVNNETGFIIELRNREELISKISLLISDKELREKMGKKGKNHFYNHFTLAHFEQALKNVFDKILD